MDYARYLAASLFYLAIHNQRDAAGLIVFDDEVRNYIRPSTRQGQLHRLLSGLEHAEPRARTDFAKPLRHFQEFLRRRGMVLIISDFYESPENIVRTIEPLRFHGNEVVLFHVLDPQEIRPELGEPALLGRPGDRRSSIEVTPDYAQERVSRQDGRAHRRPARPHPRRRHGLLPARDRPAARRRAARIPHHPPREKLNGISGSLVSGRPGRGRPAALSASAAPPHQRRRSPFSSLMFFERRTQSSIKHRRLRYLLLLSLRLALLLSAGARLRQSLHQPPGRQRVPATSWCCW